MRYKAAVLFAFLIHSAPVFSADLIWRNPSHGPFFWNELSVTPGGYYLPSQGVVLKSTNAHDWTLHYQPTPAILFSIAQSPEKILAVGGNWDHPQANPAHPSFYI